MRTAALERVTGETRVRVALDLDGGPAKISTGLAFFDHMLMQLARHGGLGLEVEATGDLAVDGHHLVEDVGLCLGEALKAAMLLENLRFHPEEEKNDPAFSQQLAALCDKNTERLQAVAREYNVARTYTDINQCLAAEKPDVFCFSTQPAIRLCMVKLALKHKVKAIAIEKPMAMTEKECDDILEAEARTGLRLDKIRGGLADRTAGAIRTTTRPIPAIAVAMQGGDDPSQLTFFRSRGGGIRRRFAENTIDPDRHRTTFIIKFERDPRRYAAFLDAVLQSDHP